MVFIDTNIVYHKDHPEVTLRTALAAFESGFDAIVLNYICTGKPDKSDKGIPDSFVESIYRAINDRSTAAGARVAALRVLNPARPRLRVYKRLTMVIEEKAQAQGLGQQSTHLTKAYDVIAVTTLSDAVFQEVFPALDIVDIVSLDVRSTFPLKRKVLNTIASKGIKLELPVAPAIEKDIKEEKGKEKEKDGRQQRYQMQRNFVGQGLELVEETSAGRRGVIISSGARSPLETRSPQDLANVGVVLGMSMETAYSAVSTSVEAMITRGFTRKSTHVGLAMVTPMKK